jgi:S-formylglutathione hydrolase FrmB
MKTLTKNLVMIFAMTMAVLFANAQYYMKLDASFYSEALDEVKMVDVFLPADYYVNPEQQYAVVYFLHGGGGDQNSGLTRAQIYYATHAGDTTISSPPAIFVCPDGSSEPYMGSCYLNSELYGNYEDYIMQDVIGFIESNFRVMPDKNFRMVTGQSMGGFGSVHLGVEYPEMFRASFPYIGFPAIPDTLFEAWKNLYYTENGSYVPVNNSGFYTQLLLTMCGGLSPNMNNPPLYVDFPFDTMGVFVDSVVDRWRQFDASSKVKNLPGEDELAWFLGCGTTDYMMTYPGYLQFMDSLDAFEIGYDTHFFEGGHVYNYETWIAGFHWMDSIINLSYQSVGISNYSRPANQFTVYPVPATDRINISYKLNDAAQVEISINDLQGRLIEQIHFGKLQQGEYNFSHSVSHLSPGIYFCRMQLGGEVLVKKIIKN